MNPRVVYEGSPTDTATEPPLALEEERKRASFPIRPLTYWLDGGEDNTNRMEEAMMRLERDPAFSNEDEYDLTMDQRRERAMERIAALYKYVDPSEYKSGISIPLQLVNLIDASTGTRLGIHIGPFFNCIHRSGTESQLQYWLKKGAFSLRRFYGCFAMTELGHGSNLAGLETTATWDKHSDEFIINTPNVAATKWWIGGGAHTANHAAVFARLIVNGVDYGTKSFIVPLRAIESHEVLPGISIGDCGKKMGRDGIDNGWIQFSQVRIPREYMMMRYTKVDREGTVTEPPLNQLSYGPLIGGRVGIAQDSYHCAKRFLTIAIRYAAVRRQFSIVPGEPETKLLDYAFHQRRLMPRLAQAFAIHAATEELHNFYVHSTAQLERATNGKATKSEIMVAIEDAKELFASSAGIKAFSTWACAEIIDECRQACGGHGYSAYNGFGQAYDDWVVQCTWEGDNNILALSSGRALIQSGLRVLAKKPVGKTFHYLRGGITPALSPLDETHDILQLWEGAARSAVMDAVAKFSSLRKLHSVTECFEMLSQERFIIAQAHANYYMVQAFCEAVASSEGRIKPVLNDLLMLYALWSVESHCSLFLSQKLISAEQADSLTELVNEYCIKVRRNAVAITDAFNLSDFFINSPIGSRDGDVYRRYFDKVRRANPGV